MDILFEITYSINILFKLLILNLKSTKYLSFGKNNLFKFVELTKNKSKEIKINNKCNIYCIVNMNFIIKNIYESKIKLNELDLYNNQIKRIPKELGNLENLDLYYNQIKRIPKELDNIKNKIKY